MKTRIMGLVLALALFTGTAWAGEPVIIVNKEVDIVSMNSKTLRYVFLGKKTSWDGYERIIPVALESGSAHKEFLKTYVRKTPSQFSTHWKRMTFTGKAESIRTFASEAELASFVASTPGAIGYVSSSVPVAGAKIVEVQ